MSASELASRLNAAAQQPGTSLVRMRLEIKQPAADGKSVLQLQAKERHSANGAEVVFQVLWPKERKGEAVLLRRSGRSISGSTFTPPDTVKSLSPAQMRDAFFGSDLSYEDVIENFFAWDQQKITGSEVVNGVNCQILESKPGKGGHSSYGMVRSWIDTRRLVPLRVEKYSGSGSPVRRIAVTRVVSDPKDRHIPANLTVTGPGGGSATELDGSRIKYGVSFSDRDFTPEGLKEVGEASATPE
ncbi:outer membrane lipoprotein-sorting protein [Verrucomicrobiota bacterium sgz303538]